VLLGEFDPKDEIFEPGRRLFATWKDIYGDMGGVELKWVAGHNHISGDVAGQEWGEDVVGWMRKLTGSDT
jgi:hypothetical protein